jgi:uncharacterized membrane protein
MTLESSKNMGGIGAILLVIGPLISYAAGAFALIIDLAGLILLFVGLKGFADYYKDSGIFNNALYALIIGIIGAVISIVLIVTAAIGLLNALGIDIANLSNITNIQQIASSVTWDKVAPYVIQIVLSLVLLVVFIIAAAIFFRRSMNSMSQKVNVHLFATAGLLFLIGAVLLIVIIGLLLLWISMILVAVAFFQISSQPVQQPVTPPPAP